MVHVKQVELSHFKSFGGTASLALEQGFTVVTGPNGSGKSNIIDGLLFCLGLASSRGMRAERLPDLINSGRVRDGKAAEMRVSVVFDLGDWSPDAAEEGLPPPGEGPWIASTARQWTVSRRLRLAPGGTYSSQYFADGEPCNLQQLQTQLRRLRVDPEGSNVVMQGDVTRIVSMSARDRRQIIDELAGVALFDRRIEQSRGKLDAVRQTEERCRIVRQELLTARQKLERDCARTRTYQDLRQRLHQGRLQEQLLLFEAVEARREALVAKQAALREERQSQLSRIDGWQSELAEHDQALAVLQAEVKALGEDKLLAVQAELGGLEAVERELQRSRSQLQLDTGQLEQRREGLQARDRELGQLCRELEVRHDGEGLHTARQSCSDCRAAVELLRRRLAEVADRSGAWLQAQQSCNVALKQLRQQLDPLAAEELQLHERLHQEREMVRQQHSTLAAEEGSSQQGATLLNTLSSRLESLQAQLTGLRQQRDEQVQGLAVQQRTREQLAEEQTRLEQELARLDSRREALQESRGGSALRLLLKSGMEGIHGPVAQLGEVEERYRLALDVAAGARLAHVVVDDDGIASRAIALLKQRRAGRLTFLPLNRIRPAPGGTAAMARPAGAVPGLVGRAIDLVRHESLYAAVLAYVFGSTLVFESLADARRQLGRHRAVTLEGELLETSGAMTGGSLLLRSDQLGFGRDQLQDDAEPVRRRLLDLAELLETSRRREADHASTLDTLESELSARGREQAVLETELATARRQHGPVAERLERLQQKLAEASARLCRGEQRWAELTRILPALRQQLSQLEQQAEGNAEGDADAARWHGLQAELRQAEQRLDDADAHRDALLTAQRNHQRSKERLEDQQQALQRDQQALVKDAQALATRQSLLQGERSALETRRDALLQRQQSLQEVFGERRRARDAMEATVTALRQQLQKGQWALEQLEERLLGSAQEQEGLERQILQQGEALPDPLPEVPAELREAGLETLQVELVRLQQRMEALEPVNMLALEELAQLEERFGALETRLDVLAKEREELLLRIETVATLRQDAFMEAFRSVDGHFQEIFAGLSDGEGHLQLENKAEPLEGGLTLVAHPKGKPVRRLASMSGGEKSLTALSFLFALQRFRPSPFYAFDEVDSFLDGVNVERLANLIREQSAAAQFLVVSHRRPMIGAASRTIGVTQARGAHTQVVGLPLETV